jgi:integrase/recombinase XerD
MTSLAPTLEAYCTDRLIRQRRASPHTIASYRDTFRLLLGYIHRTAGTPPSRLEITDLDAATVGAFLQHLEHERGNTARTRNIRLAAIHSFFRFCALRHPEHAALIQRVLAIPRKRDEKRTVTFLTPVETQALLDAPNRSTWAGRRDHALLLTAVQTGLRVSELLGLTRADAQLGTGAHVRTVGKGRKERVAPLTKHTVAVLRPGLRETADHSGAPLFPSRDGDTLTRDAIERRLAQHVKTAQDACGSLRSKRVTMHTMRHTAAMNLLAAGVDTSTIALWLGHE